MNGTVTTVLKTAATTRPQRVEPRIAEANSWFRRWHRGVLACVGFAVFFLVSAPALAVEAVAPALGAAAQFGALGNSGVTGSTAPGTVVNGNVGSAPTAPTITNFPPSTVQAPFVLYTAADPVTAQAHADAAAAYSSLAGQGLGTPLGDTLNNLTLEPGLYSSGAADLGASTTLTLNDPSPDKTGIFVFNVASSLTMNVGSVVTGTANPCNVYWRVGSSATLNGNSFMGTVIADTSITVGGGNVSGRLLAGAVTATGIVTMSTGGNTIGGCSAPVLPPTLGKAFGPSTIDAGGVSTLTITLSNPDATAATLTSALTDTLPVGVVVAPAPAAGTTCGGGVVTADAGAGTVTLSSGSTIPANSNCTVTVDVTAAVGGSYINTLNAGALETDNGNNEEAAIATLTVVSPVLPPTLGKAFGPATIDEGGVSTLTITLSNPDAATATLTSALTDTLPVGVVIAAPPNAATTCGGGTVTANAGEGTVTLSSGSTIPATGSCTVTVDVTAAVGGSYINTLPAGALATSNGNNEEAAIATLTVASPILSPTLGKAFGPSTINAGGVSTLTITLSNSDATVATLSAALTDTLPGGVVVAPTPAAATTCGGGTVTASAGAGTVTLSSGSTIPATGSCTVTVDVTAAVGGSYINTLNAGALVTDNGNNAAAAIATLTVVSPVLRPTLGKAFDPATINAGGVSTLTITLSNPDPATATLTSALTDTLPGGVVVAPVPAAATTCGGTAAVTANAGAGTVTLSSGSTIPATGSCTVAVDVTAAVGGSYINTLPAGALATSNGNNAAAAVATLTVPALAITTLTTQASSSVTFGGSISDTATLSGGIAPTGTITFNLYGPNDALCAGAAIFTTSVAVSGNGNYLSAPFTPTTIGTYRWVANYSGNSNNLPTANGCNELNERVDVTAVLPSAVVGIPTLSEWAMIMLAMLLAIVGFAAPRIHGGRR